MCVVCVLSKRGDVSELGDLSDPCPPLPSPAGFQMDDSLFSALDNMDILVEPEAPSGSQVMVSGAANSVPEAVGYLISTTPPGHLPEEFWGYERQQASCSMFKVSAFNLF